MSKRCSIFLQLGGESVTEERENTKEFIRFLKSIDEKRQIGLHLTIEGLKVLSEQQKKRHENR